MAKKARTKTGTKTEFAQMKSAMAKIAYRSMVEQENRKTEQKNRKN